jgi:eukaryotic-like serine/threonine-protein kinase
VKRSANLKFITVPEGISAAHFTTWWTSRATLVRLALAIGALFLVLFVIDAVVAFRFSPNIREVGWDGITQDAANAPAWIVKQVSVDGPASGQLHPGDVITAFNGDASILAVPPQRVLDTLPAGNYTLTLNGQREVILPLVVTRHPALYAQISVNLILSLVFFATGMMIALVKPDEDIGWRAWASALTAAAYIAYVAANPTALSDLRGMVSWVPNLFSAVFPLHFIAAYRFIAVFPVSFPISRRRRMMERALLGSGWLVWAMGATLIAASMASIDQLRRIGQAVPGVFQILDAIRLAQLLYMAFPILATTVVAILHYRRLSDEGQRRRVRWVFVGIVVSAVPMIATTVCFVAWQAMGIVNQMQPALALMSGISNLMLAAVPISISYAVLKHRVLGIQVVVRRGVQYLLAANALRILVALPVIVLAWEFVLNPNRTVPQLLFEGPAKWNSVLFLFAAAGLRYRTAIRDAIDRRFFRESYNQERIIAGLVSTMTQADSVRSLCFTVTHELEAALHPHHLHIYVYENHEMALTHSSIVQAALPLLPAHCEAFDLLAQLGTVSWTDFQQHHEERYWKPLKPLEAELLVPILSTAHKLVGLIALGSKKSEEPYTKRDRTLLESVAAQIGVLQENLSLRSMVNAQQTVEREVLARLTGQQIDVVKECPACGRCYSSTALVCEADGGQLVLTVPVERTIDARYRLDRLLGRGGMGAVYAAQDLRLNRAVAVKVMKGGLFGDASAVRRFSREAQAAARLNHPNIVRIFDFGSLVGDGAYQVLELVGGRSWRAALTSAGQWTPQFAMPLCAGVLDGLTCAHDAGIVHRDLKPDNILLAPAESAEAPALTARILDFGLAKIHSGEMSESTSVTRPGTAVGTYRYMSPEQLAGGDVDPRTDLYSFGVMLLETLTGPVLLKGFNVHDQIQESLKSRFEFEEVTAAHLTLRDVIAKSMAPDRIGRYSSAAALSRELAPALSNCPPLPDRRAQLASTERLAQTVTMYVPAEEGK